MADKNGWPDLEVGQRERENLDLFDIQSRHHCELLARGILEKALAASSITEYHRNKMTNLTRASVHLIFGNDRDGNLRETSAIRIVTPELQRYGRYFNHDSCVDVVYSYPELGSVDLANDFSMEEAEVVFRMLDELLLAKMLGTLPDLSKGRSTIDAGRPVHAK